jgi:PIN domain nuclease of toxin-antitoxin system
VKYLLDTNALIYWLEGSKRIPKRLQSDLARSDNEVFVSVISTFEIAVKASLGRLSLPGEPAKTLLPFLDEAGLEILPLSSEHSLKIYDLPWHHRDPFDRLLIAQAMLEDMTLVTSDADFSSYPVKIVLLK